MYSTLKNPVHLRMPKHHKMLLPAALVAIAILLLPALVAAQAASSGSTLRAVGTTANGSNAGTSGTDPGFSDATPRTAGQPTATSRQTLGAVGTNVDGQSAGTSGTNPGVAAATTGNPLNRNPENRISATTDAVPVTSGDASQGAATAFGSRDTLVAPDLLRDSVRTQ